MHHLVISQNILYSVQGKAQSLIRGLSSVKLWTCLVILSLLSACGSTTTGYVSPADIKPVYVMRNSPRYPAPLPKMRPYRAAKVVTRTPSVRYLARASLKTVTVRRGDTLYSLSKRYGVQVRDLAQVNRIRPPYALSVGQKIQLPSQASHTVKKGETTYAIAQQYQVRLSDLIKLNRIRSPYALSIGQKLKLPGGAIRKATARKGSVRRTASSQPVKKWQPRQKPAPARTYTPPPKTGKYFAWPISGTIISRFGPKKGGIHNDGINMVARKGTAVRAAEAGVVAYASNDLPGYGNLILVKHSGNWVTAYAHTDSMTVKPGQVVKKGQMLARVGQTGGVVRPQLHFEIRRGRKALNPLLYLERNPKGQAR